MQAVVTANVTAASASARYSTLRLPNFQATATAAHRARDVCFILDYSGSMRFASFLGTPYYGNRSCNNQDTVVPTFGHYSAGSSSTGMPAARRHRPMATRTSTASTSDGRPPIAADFYTNSIGSPAFVSAPATTPARRAATFRRKPTRAPARPTPKRSPKCLTSAAPRTRHTMRHSRLRATKATA